MLHLAILTLELALQLDSTKACSTANQLASYFSESLDRYEADLDSGDKRLARLQWGNVQTYRAHAISSTELTACDSATRFYAEFNEARFLVRDAGQRGTQQSLNEASSSLFNLIDGWKLDSRTNNTIIKLALNLQEHVASAHLQKDQILEILLSRLQGSATPPPPSNSYYVQKSALDCPFIVFSTSGSVTNYTIAKLQIGTRPTEHDLVSGDLEGFGGVRNLVDASTNLSFSVMIDYHNAIYYGILSRLKDVGCQL